MAYIVNRRDGTVIATVADGTLDTTSTSITLIGKGFQNYGEIVAENWVHMVEHFASPVAPTNALRGQVWFSNSDSQVRVNISDVQGTPEWVPIGTAVINATEPAASTINTGTFWYNPNSNILSISTDGSSFVRIRDTIVQAAIPSAPDEIQEGNLWYDTSTRQLKVYNSNLHTIENGTTTTEGFDVIGPARHSAPLDANNPSLGPVGFNTTTNQQAQRVLDGDLWWNTLTKQLFAYDADNGNQWRLVGPSTPANEFTSSVGQTEWVSEIVDGNPLLLGYIDNELIMIVSGDQFNPTTPFTGFDATIYRGLNMTTAAGAASNGTVMHGAATSSFYADLAERYEVDYPAQPGDLVKLGGECEVTQTMSARDTDVFGVVSENPGLMLNAGAGKNDTHPFIAMTGRVPCKVVGKVKKGSRLVSSVIPGVAMAIESDEVQSNYVAVFGRALENYDSDTVGIIEVTVGVK